MTNPEQLTSDKGVFVEKARIGDTEIIVAFSEHTAENMPAIVSKMRDCQIVAIECVGLANEEVRQEMAASYTHLIESQFDQQAAKEGIEPLRAQDFGALLYELVGSDKQIVLLDINADHPEFPKYVEANQKKQAFVDCLSDVKPIGETVEAMLEATQSVAESNKIREGIQANQLAELSKKAGDAKVGVILGATHTRAIDDIADGQGHNAENRSRIADSQRGFDRIVEKKRAGEKVEETLVHKSILEAHYLFVDVPKHEANKLIKEMDDDMVVRILDGINRIAITDEPKLEKRKQARAFLKAVADIAKDL